MQPYKIFFDRSAFHGANFKSLQTSPLLALSKNHKLKIFHAPIFLEETLRLHRTDPAELKRQLPFILSICNSGWLLDRPTLCHEELVKNKADKTNPVASPKDQQKHEQQIRLFGIDGRTDHFPYVDALIEDDERYKTTVALKETLVSMRADVIKKAKVRRIKISPGKSEFEDVMASERFSFGKLFIEKHIQCRNPAAIAEMWFRYRSRYRFFSAFLDGLLFSAYSAMLEPNESIDRNASADVELMMYMPFMDILISNDSRFLRTTFNNMWRPKGKIIFSTQDFSNWMAHL